MGLLIRFVVTFIAVFVADLLLPDDLFRMGTNVDGIIFAAILALMNAFVRPVVLALTCPLQILTLGLSALIINALLFYFAGTLAQGLGAQGVVVDGILGALVAAIVVSIVSWAVSIFIRT